ncbi:MAG: hypothetical protein FWG51_05000, partial [Firmicutes bacterium]|nr:hypothetical protein [Bacillota bacterium]
TVAVYVETVVEEEWLMARLWFWDGDDYVEYSESILTQLYGDDEILDIEVDEGGTTVADIIALYIELGGIQGSKIPVGEPFFDEFAYGIAAQVYDLLGVDLIESISSELSGIMVAGGVTLNLYFGEPSPFIVIESFPYSISLDFSTIDNTTPFMFVFTLEEETTLDITCGHPAMNRYIRIYDNASLVDPMFASGNNIYAETFDAGTYYVVVEKNSGPDITETFSVSVAVE